jgi:hypothetical protein
VQLETATSTSSALSGREGRRMFCTLVAVGAFMIGSLGGMTVMGLAHMAAVADRAG